jgi:cytidylate kinase
MENILRECLERTFPDDKPAVPCSNGPVVTISREFGCPSKLIAQMLAEAINRTPAGHQQRWRFINKEIVETTAKELEMNPTELNFMLNAGAKGLLSDVLASFTNYYVSNHRMRKTIIKVVSDLAAKGRIIIVGRGSAGILGNCGQTLHIRLSAPLEWRTERICLSKGVTREEAQVMARDVDARRTSLIELITGQKFTPYMFDLTFNCQTMSNEEMVATILGAMQVKKMI